VTKTNQGAQKPAASPSSPPTPLGGCLLRAFWMVLGNALLAFAAIAIATNHERFLSLADAAFWICIAALLVARYIDIRKYSGLTGAGEAATMVHWRRYALVLAAAAAVLWGLAHLGARFTSL